MSTRIPRPLTFAASAAAVLLVTPGGLRAQDDPNRSILDQVRRADSAMAQAVAERDVERFARFIDDDATFFGRRVSRGRDEVVKAWEPLFTDPNVSLNWWPERVEACSAGDMAFTIGHYERKVVNEKGEAEIGQGTYVTIWHQRAGGVWQAMVDIGTPPSPPPLPTPGPAPGSVQEPKPAQH